MKALITESELKEIFEKPGVRLLDASYGLPPTDIRIGHALDFDIDEVADPNAPLAHTLPTPTAFADAAEKFGISNGDHVIVYDRSGVAMAACPHGSMRAIPSMKQRMKFRRAVRSSLPSGRNCSRNAKISCRT